MTWVWWVNIALRRSMHLRRSLTYSLYSLYSAQHHSTVRSIPLNSLDHCLYAQPRWRTFDQPGFKPSTSVSSSNRTEWPGPEWVCSSPPLSAHFSYRERRWGVMQRSQLFKCLGAFIKIYRSFKAIQKSSSSIHWGVHETFAQNPMSFSLNGWGEF